MRGNRKGCGQGGFARHRKGSERGGGRESDGLIAGYDLLGVVKSLLLFGRGRRALLRMGLFMHCHEDEKKSGKNQAAVSHS